MGRKFDSPAYMIRSVEKEIRGFHNLIEIVCEKDSTEFSYMLKHKAIQRRANRFGFIDLITNTNLPGEDVLRIYRDKDRAEKAFSRLKPHLEPFFSKIPRKVQGQGSSLPSLDAKWWQSLPVCVESRTIWHRKPLQA